MSETILETRSVDIDILGILRRGPTEWNQWREEHLLVSIDLSNAQLSQAKLNGANLNGVNLHRADLSGAQLNRADLSHADLRLAELRGVNLSSAVLNWTKLHGADLKQSDLSRASLMQAKLNGTDLSRSDLRFADLSQAGFSNVNLSNADLTGTNLNKAYFHNVNFSGTKLGFINLVKYRLEAFWRHLNAVPAQGYYNIDVRIFDTQVQPEILENLQSAIELFISSSGYELVATIHSVNTLVCKDIRYKVIPSLTPKIDGKGIKIGFKYSQRGSSTIKSQTEHLGVQPSQQLAQVTASVLNEVEEFDNIILLLGQLAIIKYIDNRGKSNLFTKTISSKLQKQLTSGPTLLFNPQDFVNFLSNKADKVNA